MVDPEPLVLVLAVIGVGVSFAVSASAGLGGSLVLVPTLALVLGTKEGVALAALLLGANNVVKVFAYRRTLPFRSSALVVVFVALGAGLGARLLVAAPDRAVTIAVIVVLIGSLLVERRNITVGRKASGPVLAFGSGATSGFSGTSGPLKGVAIRTLHLDRAHFVGAASLASLAGDATKTAVFVEARIIGTNAAVLAFLTIPLMFVSTFVGRRINRTLGERGYSALFWSVMTGYTIRLLVLL